jgi:copper chaperone NosL
MKRRSVLFGPLSLAVLSLAACKRDKTDAALPPPREITDAAVGQFCGMALSEHAGPKAQIFVRHLPDPYWFATVRDAFAFAMLPEMPKAIIAIYVSDMARARNWDQPEAGTWVEAHRASFVIGSDRRSGMATDEAIPFGDDAAARRFAAANSGRVVRFAEMPRDYILTAPPGRS